MGVVRRMGKDGKAVYCIRYYGPDGRQRWETIGPNKREAETVLHQRLYEVRTGKFPIIARRTRMTLTAFAEEWKAKHLVRVRASTAKRYRELLTHQLLPVFGGRLLSAITPAATQAFIAGEVRSARLAPKTVNLALALLKQMLAAAADWGYLAASPLGKVQVAALAASPAVVDARRNPAVPPGRPGRVAPGVDRCYVHWPPPRGDPGDAVDGAELA